MVESVGGSDSKAPRYLIRWVRSLGPTPCLFEDVFRSISGSVGGSPSLDRSPYGGSCTVRCLGDSRRVFSPRDDLVLLCFYLF